MCFETGQLPPGAETWRLKSSPTSCGTLYEMESEDGFIFRIIYMSFHHSYYIAYLILPDHYVWSSALSLECLYHPDAKNLLALYLPERYDLWNYSFLLTSLPNHPPSRIPGPLVLVKDMLLLWSTLRFYEQIELQKKKRIQLSIFEEELFQKALHPTRVERWVQSGMDL